VETKNCYAGPIWQNALGKILKPDFQNDSKIILQSALIDAPNHTLFLVIEADDHQMLTSFLRPLQDAGYAKVVPVSDLIQLHSEKNSVFQSEKVFR